MSGRNRSRARPRGRGAKTTNRKRKLEDESESSSSSSSEDSGSEDSDSSSGSDDDSSVTSASGDEGARNNKKQRKSAAKDGAGASKFLQRSQEEQANMLRNAARYALFKHSQKKPIAPDAEFRKAISPNAVPMKERNELIMDHVKSLLESTFDFTLEQMEEPPKAARPRLSQTAAKKASKAKPMAKYIVCHKRSDAPNLRSYHDLTQSPFQQAERGFLLLVLSLIQLKGGEIKETMLWDSLEKLHLHRTNSDPQLGNIPQLLNKFKKEMYLSRELVDRQLAKGETLYQWKSGPRAKVEVTDLTQFIDAVVNNVDDVGTAQAR